jgi:hypothetical protein
VDDGRVTSSQTPADPGALVLSEDAALQVLAYLVTAARRQVDEAAEYGPMRLLTAARRLVEGITHGTGSPSAPLRDLAARLATLQPVKTPTRDREEYVARLDAWRVEVAECVLDLVARDREEP